MKKYRVGKIINTCGLKGEIKIFPTTDDIKRFNDINTVFIKENKYSISSLRYNKNFVYLFLKDIDTINKAQKFKGQEMFIDETELRELADDEYMIYDLIGLDVYVDDKKYGTVSDVLNYSANDVLTVKRDIDSKEIMIPMVKEFIKKVDLSEKCMEVKLIDGMDE